MIKKINVAFIGGSFDSTIGNTHLRSLLATGKFNLTCGFFSRQKSKNKFNSKKFNLDKKKVYNSLRDLLFFERNKIDLAIVLTPPNSRYKIYKELVKNNVSFISEKPFEGSLQNAIKSFKLIKSKRNFFGCTYNYLGYPGIMEIKPLVKNKIGKILNFNLEMPQQTFVNNLSGVKRWRLDEKTIPNIHLDLASHLISLLIYFFDQYPKKVLSLQENQINKKVVDNSYVWLKFKNFGGNLWFSKNSAGERNQLAIRVYGSKGSLEWKHKNPENIIFKKNNGEIEIIDRLSKNRKFINNNSLYTYSAGHPNGFLDAFINIYNNVFEIFTKKKVNYKSSIILNLRQNVNIISILNSINQSAKDNIWKKVKIIK